MKNNVVKMPASCSQITKIAWDYYENKLDNQLRSDVEHHLSNCQQCRSVYLQTVALQQVIDKQKQSSVSPFIATVILNRYHEKHRQKQITSFLLKPVLISLVFVAMIAAGFFSGSIIAGKIFTPDEVTGINAPDELFAEQALFRDADFYTPGYEYLNE
jgi:predicted anti-sigma-YlaC factor YlaD